MLVMSATRGTQIVEAAVEFARLGDENASARRNGFRRRAAARCRRSRSSDRRRIRRRAKLIMALVVDLPWVPATATPNRSPITIPSIWAYLTVLSPRAEAAIISRFLSGTAAVRTTKIDFWIQQFPELVPRNFCTFAEEFDGHRPRPRLGTGDDCPGVKKHSRQPAHPATPNSDKMHPFAAELTGGGRFRSLLGGKQRPCYSLSYN